MAVRGAKPKPANLRLVAGTHRPTRHGEQSKAQEQVEIAAADFGKLQMPSYLKAQAAWAWKRYIAPAGWLDASREASAIAFCELWKEFRDGPRMFAATKHGQMRAYMSELGLTDERNRSDVEKSEVDEFFGSN